MAASITCPLNCDMFSATSDGSSGMEFGDWQSTRKSSEDDSSLILDTQLCNVLERSILKEGRWPSDIDDNEADSELGLELNGGIRHGSENLAELLQLLSSDSEVCWCPIPITSVLPLCLALNVDWFQPFKHTQYSVGALYFQVYPIFCWSPVFLHCKSANISEIQISF